MQWWTARRCSLSTACALAGRDNVPLGGYVGKHHLALGFVLPQVRDFVHTHEYASGGLAFRKAVRVRTYDATGEVPLVVLSVSDDPTQNVTQDIERIVAEVLLGEYPEEAVRAEQSKLWFSLVEHPPPSYDLARPRESCREVFFYFKFDDYRVTVDWSLDLHTGASGTRRGRSRRTREPSWGCRA
jgi:hypothetical protein